MEFRVRPELHSRRFKYGRHWAILLHQCRHSVVGQHGDVLSRYRGTEVVGEQNWEHVVGLLRQDAIVR